MSEYFPRVAVGFLFFLSLAGTGFPGSAWAYPEMVRHNYPNCTSCHVSPSGGGVLTLVAKEQACEHPTLACHGEACPLARGFYDKLPAARAEAVGWYRAAATARSKRNCTPSGCGFRPTSR